MQKNHLNRALKATREMIKSYFVDRSIDGLIKHLSSEKFTFFGGTEDHFYNSKEEFLEYATKSLENTLPYELIGENYSVEDESQDSCLIVVKILLKDTRTQKILIFKYVFYFKQQKNRIICTHYHVILLLNLNLAIKPLFFNSNEHSPKLYAEIISEYEDLIKSSSSISTDLEINVNQNITIYPRTNKIRIDDEIIYLTPFECKIFLVLLDNLNKPIKSEKIYETIYKNSALRKTSSVLRMHISNIRRKLRPHEDLIQIIYEKDVGYYLRIQNAEF